MAYETFTEFNNTDLEGLFLYPAEVVTIFIPMLLLTLFTIVMLGVYFSQRRQTGRGDFFAAFAVAGYFTFIIATLMSLIGGLIDSFTLVICLIVAVIGTALLLASRER